MDQTPNTTQEQLVQLLTSPDLDTDQIKQQLTTPNEAVCFLLHALMIRHGFRLVGTDEQEQPQEQENQYILPTGWNRSKDVFTFKYKHSQSGMMFVLKCMTLGGSLLISAVSVEEGKPYMMEIKTIDYVVPDNAGKLDQHLIDYYRDLQNLESLFKINIANKLVPFLNKQGYEDTQTQQQPVQQEQQQRQEPQRRQPPPPSYERPDDYDPLRIGPVRRPPQRFVDPYGADRGFGVGGNDLYPTLNEPFAGTHRGGAPMFIGGGGNMVGPNHPGFFGGPAPMRGGGRGLPQGVPRGARFDPYGPNVPRSGEPNPDELRPPQFNEGDDDVNPFFF
jgi:proteasome inhibitor subunit 1 (PI31)